MSRFLKSLFIVGSVALFSSPESCFGQVGREYDNTPVPRFVSHLSKKNRAVLARSRRAHGIFRMILCMDVRCRKNIGRNRRLHAVSFEDFKKDIRKNARKGIYKDLRGTPPRKQPANKPVPQPVEKDSVIATLATATVEAPVIKSDSLIVLGEVLFETNSYKLKNEHIAALDSILAFLTKHPSLVARISGHTDNMGKESYNHLLSTQRAEVVSEYFTDQGIGVDRITFEGFGSTVPIAPNDTSLNRAKNRRVEILIHDKR